MHKLPKKRLATKPKWQLSKSQVAIFLSTTLLASVLGSSFQSANGQEAVEIVQEAQIHLLLLDMHMPHMNGLEAVQKIQQLERPIPCILFSARLDEDLARKAFQAQVFSVLAKPFRLAQITEMVRGALLTTYGWTPHS